MTFSFRPVERRDLAMLADWFARPHVAEVWDEPPSEVEPDHFIALLDGTECVGFVQIYSPVECHADGWWLEEHDPGVRGIDVFLANPGDLNRGLGTAMIRALAEKLCEDPAVTRVQADPAPHNPRAIRSYQKAGFRSAGEIETPDGKAVLMYFHRADNAA